MRISEVEEFAEYVVFEIIDGKPHYICVCKEAQIASWIAIQLAVNDKAHDHYFVSGVSRPLTLVPGGGWHDEYWVDENDKLVKSSLS